METTCVERKYTKYGGNRTNSLNPTKMLKINLVFNTLILGVMTSCWYQNDRSELYFCCVFLVFSFVTLLFLVFQKNWETLCSKTNFFIVHFEMGTGITVEKMNKYVHDDDAVRLCQNNVLRVFALKI